MNVTLGPMGRNFFESCAAVILSDPKPRLWKRR